MTDPTPQTPAPAQASAAEVLSLEDAARAYREAVAPLDTLRATLREADARCVDDRGVAIGSREDWEALRDAEDALALQQGQVAVASRALRDAALAAAQPAPAPASADAGLREALARYEAADERCACAFTNDMRGMVERRTAENERRNATVALAEAARALLTQSTPPAGAGAEAEEKAALWDALIGCARIRVGGWAGMDREGNPEEKDLRGDPYNGYAHLGLELWSRYGDYSDLPNEVASHERSKALLTGFARIALAQAQAEGGEAL